MPKPLIPKPLIIVESPAKARTIAGFLGGDYDVASSVGHIRDLPRTAKEIPTKYKDKVWAKDWGIDIDNGFAPLYIVQPDKRDVIKQLKALVADASELYLATDEDREGEGIAWHLLEVLKPKIPVRRMVFHEITRDAIQHAIDNPREINQQLVDAQEARRTLDRLYGYGVSPVLWRKVKPRLSAGRVQSVAVRIIVERERERIGFNAAGYWDIEATVGTNNGKSFTAKLIGVDGSRLATGKNFDESGTLIKQDLVVLDAAAAQTLADDLATAPGSVRAVERKPYKRSPFPPFRTSTLQQDAGRKFRFGAARTMSAAQRLYENGFITYMRTDSTTLSQAAVDAARGQISELYGSQYLSAQPRTYANKVKNAQEAHEAIRPAGDVFQHPDVVATRVGGDEAKVYELIWKRTLASQMADARGESVTVRIDATSRSGRPAEFTTAGRVIHFRGFLAVYTVVSDDPEADRDKQERALPPVSEGDDVTLAAAEANGHETKPPARYTEASLVRKLEELGIGRPSTYASIIATIQYRGYVWKKASALVPSVMAFATVRMLEDHFTHLVDYAFTAGMEQDLDRIANGDQERVPWLSEFFHGNGTTGLLDLVSPERLEEIDPAKINSISVGTDDDGNEILARVGKFGPYLERGEDTASLPEDLPLDELTVERATEILDAPNGDKILGTDPESGLTVIARNGRFGPYVQLGGNEENSKTKPKTSSLFKSMTVDEMSLEAALELLTLPRVVGVYPETEEEITAQNGRYGPYLKMGKDSRSIDAEEQLLTLTLDEAIEVFKQPKRRRGQAAPQPPLKELGKDPVSDGEVLIKEGRFGLYATDGIVNASFQKQDTIESIELDRAAFLLQARRDRMAAKGQWPPKKK